MSRYLLIPNFEKNDDNAFKSVLLVPTEFNGQIKELDVPKGILHNISAGENLSKKQTIQDMLLKMDKANIGRNKDGQLVHGSKILDINFDDFIHDSCSGKFSNYYEPIYCILRTNGITF